jgi:choice-of-anchor B domain-containing protein
MHSRSLAVAAIVAALSTCTVAATAQIATRNMQFLAQRDDYAPAPGTRGYSSCTSYIHPDGREYAVLGVRTGTAIYNVTDPANTRLVAFIPGPASQWRNMKSYRSWIYVSTEGLGPSPPPGIQIIRMADSEHPVLAATWTGTFIRCHTVAVDTARALLICNGARNAGGHGVGMFILSIASPESPVELAQWPGGRYLDYADSQYVHTSFVRGSLLFASCIDGGKVRVFDLGNPAAPVEISSWSYPGAYTHTAALDRTGRWLYVTDEVKGEPLKIFDVSDLHAPVLVNTLGADPEAVVHTVHVRGDELYLANFTAGARVLDITDPAHPAEFAWADSWLRPEGPFYSVWNVSSRFPSGTVIASDMQSGLYVYRPVRDYGILRVQAVDAATLLPIAGAEVTLTTQGDSLTTPADGIVQFGPSPGAHTVFVRRFGYESASATRLVSAGSRDTVLLALAPLPAGDLEGTVRAAATRAPIEDAEVGLAGTSIHVHTGTDGRYVLSGVPDGGYQVEVRRPGYGPVVFGRGIGPGFAAVQDVELMHARTWDPLETETGWTIGAPGDRAVSGIWTRVAPYPAGGTATAAALARAEMRDGAALEAQPKHQGQPVVLYPHEVQPGLDRTPDPGAMCFVTGQGTNQNDIWQNAVYGGGTSLTSPRLDLTGMTEPAIGCWRWFYSDGDANDGFLTLISNDDGATWAPVDTTRGFQNHWEEATVRVRDHVVPTTRVRLRFVAMDGGLGSTVEAAVDDIITYDAAASPVSAAPGAVPARLAFRAPQPNPAGGPVSLSLVVPRAGQVEVEVLDLAGRRVRTLHRGAAAAGVLTLRWDGADESGRSAPAGLYFARARCGAAVASVRLVRMP